MVGEQKILISPELKEFIVPLTNEEFRQLQSNIIQEGCHEPLTVWAKPGGKLVLIDGHNRYQICQRHNIPFKIRRKSFPNVDAVKVWMANNQLGRRNLSQDQLSYYRGMNYLTLRQSKGGYSNVERKGKKQETTSTMLSDQFNVSESTIKRDARFAEGLNIIGRSNPVLKGKILNGEVKVRKADIQLLPSAATAHSIVIRSEADLHNKAKNLRADIITDAEQKVKKLDAERVKRSQKILEDKEPLFLSVEDRTRKIKGMIISAINRAIKNKDIQAIKELKSLIEKLANEIF